MDVDVVMVEEVQHNIQHQHMQCKMQHQTIIVLMHHNNNSQHVHEVIHEQDEYNLNHQINYGHVYNVQLIFQKYMIQILTERINWTLLRFVTAYCNNFQIWGHCAVHQKDQSLCTYIRRCSNCDSQTHGRRKCPHLPQDESADA